MWFRIKSFFARLFRRKRPSPAPEPVPAPPAPPPPPPAPPPSPGAPCPRYRIDNLDEMGSWDRERLERAEAILNRILAHPLTRPRWNTYELVESNGLSNSEIWDLWVRGDQLADDHEDELSVTDVKIVMYHNRFSSGVGYTYLESLIVWINRKFFSTDKGRASNLGHEALGHQYGFTHTVRDYLKTVPWRVNQLIEEMYDELELHKEFPPL